MISIIDDNHSFREAVGSLVRSIGYDAVTFASAEEYLGSERVHVAECVITDVNMPGMTGIALRDKLISNGYRRPIILMSALTREEAGARATNDPTITFLKKPFSDERLVECLNDALGCPSAE
jgi:FixJ family two-component response regulator